MSQRILEYDRRHFGYLSFAMVFFWMKLKILKKGNQIFRCLRMYKFVVMVLFLAYQSPLLMTLVRPRCLHRTDKWIGWIPQIWLRFLNYIKIIICGNHHVHVRITTVLHVVISRICEKEPIGDIRHQQEKKVAWEKTGQLQHTCKTAVLKHARSLQVDKRGQTTKHITVHSKMHNSKMFNFN